MMLGIVVSLCVCVSTCVCVCVCVCLCIAYQSHLRHHYKCLASIDGTFYNFSVTRIVRMIPAKNYEKFFAVYARFAVVPDMTSQCDLCLQ